MTLNLSAFFEKHIISIISDHKSAIQNERRTRQRLSYRDRLHNGGNSARNSPSPRYWVTLIINLQSEQTHIIFCGDGIKCKSPFKSPFNDFYTCWFYSEFIYPALKGSTKRGSCQGSKDPRPLWRGVLREHIKVWWCWWTLLFQNLPK